MDILLIDIYIFLIDRGVSFLCPQNEMKRYPYQSLLLCGLLYKIVSVNRDTGVLVDEVFTLESNLFRILLYYFILFLLLFYFGFSVVWLV